MSVVPVPGDLDGALDHMRRLVDSWCDMHAGTVAALDQAAAQARDSWRDMGIDLSDPQVARAVTLTLDGFVRCAFSTAYTAGSALRARAYVIPLAAVLLRTLEAQS